MNTEKPISIILLSSLLLGGFTSFLSWLINYFILDILNLGVPLLIFLFVFIISFFILYFVLQKLILDKFKLIYKRIHSLKLDDSNLQPPDLNNDVFQDLDNEIALWAKGNREELINLQKLEIYRREFLGNVSHELKTPIFNIQGYLLTLLDGGIDDPAVNKLFLEKAEKNVDRLISIVDDLVTISHLESGQLQLELVKLDIAALAQEICEVEEFQARTKQIKLVVANQKPVWIKADKFRIRQVITNLVVNSIKYGKVNGTTEIRFFDLDEHILTEIEDNGIGIEKSHIPRLFERFYRVDDSRSRSDGGTGLGLSIVKHILDAHGQNINVRSMPGQGSNFSFTLNKA